ncbi:hypothetical protein XELAEV_18042864mg [Xenopus laevis]|uniref:Osteocalcin n=2 Tax=Xenopus laevis TaxID=8355 RepID=B7ZS46_XENLA|nr:Bone Gla protein [Xenopus laevis]AAI70395.1 Bone Gla protein [Xenopus laevis]OCT66611.1 hypothetical protein XELAEV_18042864mg [Xenopus laevis]
MKLAILTVLLLGAAVLCLGSKDVDHSNSVGESHSSEAFISRQESASFARLKRSYGNNVGQGAAVGSPLESQREVCELNPDCDELADHIGFQEAYRRFYGPV